MTLPRGASATLHTPQGRDEIADLMAFMVAQGGVIALYQGAAETGPRALGHRSILANPCDTDVRERLNERVKYREAIRPLAPMATLEAARQYFELLPGASDADYNAYNYMVLTAQSKPQARDKIPAVIHADGTGRIQIVREDDDRLTYAYLKALGRHIGVELSVNTSFNVAGPIAQTPQQAIDTLRRSKGLDVVLLVTGDGAVFAAWHGGERDSGPVYRVVRGVEIGPRQLERGLTNYRISRSWPHVGLTSESRYQSSRSACPLSAETGSGGCKPRKRKAARRQLLKIQNNRGSDRHRRRH